MSVQKRKRDLLKMARVICPTATVTHTSGTHLVITLFGPEGSRKVFAASTAGDHRDTKNVKRDLMQAARAVGCVAERTTPAEDHANDREDRRIAAATNGESSDGKADTRRSARKPRNGNRVSQRAGAAKS